MTKEEILEYVMNTPENTNRLVLNDMLNELINSSGGSSDYFDLQINLLHDETKSSGYDFECDKTYAEIAAAFEAGKKLRPMMVERDEDENYYTQPLTYTISSQNGEVLRLQFYTSAYVAGGDGVGMYDFMMYEDSSLDEANWYQYPQLT